ncbi:MAG TPA: CRTAC1 family protein [Planctomycetota bacterium]
MQRSFRLVLAALVGAALALFLRELVSRPDAAPVDPRTATPTPGEEFRAIAEDLYAGHCPQYGRAPRAAIEAQLEAPDLASGKRLPLLVDLANEYLEAGETRRSIATLEEARTLAQASGNERHQRKVLRELAQAWLREAEDQNCLQRHNAECCILPARPGAVHAVRLPAERARGLYQAILADGPENLGARWLVNLTTLLLGERLEDLPPQQRLPAAAFAAEETPDPLFRDVATAIGVVDSTLAGGVALEDFDGDGWLDLLTSTCDPRGSARYWRSRGDGTYEDRTASSGLSDQLGGLNLITGDYDEDGDQDALILRGAWLLDHGRIRNSLLRNDGGERFEDVTRAVGLAEPAWPTQAGVFGDLDGDGTLDLYVGNESRREIEDEEGKGDYPSQLFIGRDGGFVDEARARGVTNDRYAKGVAVGDADDDGDLDLYVSNIGFNRLYQNDGRGHFTDVAVTAGVLEPSGRSFACWFFDYDQDGRLDLWVNGYFASIGDLAAEALFLPHKGVAPCLYRNLGGGRFADVAREAGLDHPWLTMGANFGDGDGDGWLDVYLGTGDPLLSSLMPNVYLRNVGGRSFVNETGPSGLGHLQKGHGIGFADLDGDGDEDIVHKMGGFVPVDHFPTAVFENRSPPGARWLELSLVGTRTNRDAVGARVTLQLVTAEGPRTLHRAIGSGSSFGGSPHRLHVGLGAAERIERLEVHWPNGGGVQVFAGVPLDAWVRVTEGQPAFERLAHPSFRFPPERT